MAFLSRPAPLDLERAHYELGLLAPDAGVEELVRLAYSAGDGAFRPCQVKSEIERLLRILEHKRPKTVVEIGTANGGTLFLLTRIATEDAVVVSIDVPGGALSYGHSRQPLYEMFAEAKALLESRGARVVSIAVLVRQPTPVTPDFAPLPVYSLATLDARYYAGEGSCKLCQNGAPLHHVGRHYKVDEALVVRAGAPNS